MSNTQETDGPNPEVVRLMEQLREDLARKRLEAQESQIPEPDKPETPGRWMPLLALIAFVWMAASMNNTKRLAEEAADGASGIAALQEQVEALEGRVEELEGQVAALEGAQ